MHPVAFDHAIRNGSARANAEGHPCPFHDDRFWAELKANSPTEWADAAAGSVLPTPAAGAARRGGAASTPPAG
ncbi:hypothetical protein GCM10027280_04830 [Micromonospora polyrhachis]|uniref:Uncharacterized protein n=1 Tax=Micromonospora polyrhachis TaxID=1282883 RepID=A0A7W7SLW6_9ACTN|nr:hypothetical protein [Micromonospora polyrhachis]